MKETRVNHEKLLARLKYDPITGVFRWKNIIENNNSARGMIAGSRSKNGIVIQFLGERWTASMLAVFYMTGQAPKTRVSHINGNPLDCRYENLIIRNENRRIRK